MKIVYYAHGNAETGDRLLQIIKDQVSAEAIETYRSLSNFKLGLLQQRRKPHAAILLAADTAELKRILALDKLLADMRIVLILPDRRKESVSAGHRLRPRYISYVDGDFEDVAAVVKRMSTLYPAPVMRGVEAVKLSSRV